MQDKKYSMDESARPKLPEASNRRRHWFSESVDGEWPGTESFDSFALCLLCAAVWVPRQRRSHGTPHGKPGQAGQATMMMDCQPSPSGLG